MRMEKHHVIAGLGLLLAGCSGGPREPAPIAPEAPTSTPEPTSEPDEKPPATLPAETLALFDYTPEPVALEEVGRTQRGAVTVRDVRYPSPVDGKPIAAYLISPAAGGSGPAVLYVHWYEPKANDSNRTQFVDEAVSLAENQGAVSLLVETMWSEPTWYKKGRTLESDFDDCRAQTIELRRALDVLAAQPNVDPRRIGFVGHDFGAMFGAILAAVDRRPRFYVLIAGAPSFNDWMLYGVPPDTAGLPDYKARMSQLDPSRFAALAAPAPLLFQFGTKDFYTPRPRIDAFVAAASEPKTLRLYDTKHGMRLPAIRADRESFVRQELAKALE